MKPATMDPDRAAFYAFLDHLRDDSFAMWERVRRVERGERDGLSMCEQLRVLGEIGRTAGRIASEIEMLYAAVSFPEGAEPAVEAAVAELRQPVTAG